MLNTSTGTLYAKEVQGIIVNDSTPQLELADFEHMHMGFWAPRFGKPPNSSSIIKNILCHGEVQNGSLVIVFDICQKLFASDSDEDCANVTRVRIQ